MSDDLILAAKAAAEKAYAPYSGFRVGAALLSGEGKIISGCNVENSSYGLSICAERTAVFKAISMGIKDIKKIVVFVDSDKIATPCGACRQVLYEFNPDMEVICANNASHKKYKLKDLLKDGFVL